MVKINGREMGHVSWSVVLSLSLHYFPTLLFRRLEAKSIGSKFQSQKCASLFN